MINPVNSTPVNYPVNLNSSSVSTMELIRTGATSLGAGYIASRHCLYKLTLDKAEIGSVSQLAPKTSSLLKAGRNTALVSGLISAGVNGYALATGSIEGTKAAGNVVSDVVGGLGGGFVAAGIGSAATKLLGASASSFGVGTLGLLVGTAAFLGTDLLYNYSGAKDAISEGTKSFLDKLFKGADLPQGS